MKVEEILGWGLYWLGIAFITVCIALSLARATADDTPDPCQFERNNAVSVCRALGRKSPECRDAVDDYRLCKAEKAGRDPLEGLI
jgi:hypothetical protein